MALINYYARQGLIRHLQKVCEDKLAQRGEDPVFRFWKGWAMDMEGNPSEALREYRLVEGKREMAYAINTAMLHAHKRCKLVDQEAVDMLDAKIATEEKSATEQAIAHTALFYWHMDDHAKARDYIKKVKDYSDEYICAITIRGWIDLTCGRRAYMDKSVQYFDAVLGESHEHSVDPDSQANNARNNPDAAMGKVAYLEMNRNYPLALDVLNRMIVHHPKFTPALIQKAKVLIQHQDWEQAVELAQRVLSKHPGHVEALMLTLLYMQVRECRPTSAETNLRDLVKSLEQNEPKNASLHLKVARTVARLSASSAFTLQATQDLVETAIKLEPSRSDCLTELGYQQGLQGNHEAALKSYKQALKVDEGDVQALIGVINCQLMMGKVDEAEQQLEFLNEIQASMGKSAELLFLSALLAWRKRGDLEESIKNLELAITHMVESTKDIVASFEYYAVFNPQLLLDITKEYLQHCPTEPPEPTDPPSTMTEKAMKPLELLVRNVPGSIEGQLLFTKLKFISGEMETARHTIQSCIRLEPTLPEAHLLAAQIAFHQERYSSASQSLEQALSLDFEVRDWPMYNLLKARVQSAEGDLDEALIVLEHALALTSQGKIVGVGKGKQAINPQDHVSIYLELVRVHLQHKNYNAAKKVVTEALSEFRKTKEEGRIIICQATVAAKYDVDQALGILRSVPPNSQYFLKAKAQMAQIYLHQRNNKRAFAKCYEELVEAYPSGSSYMFLGEAYMSIQEPEKAITAFEKALAMDLNDASLASKIGKALITTHDYNKAVQYYKNAVANDNGKSGLKHDLAELYYRLGSYDKAEQVLKENLGQKSSQVEDHTATKEKVRTSLMLAKVHRASNDLKAAIDDLIQARVFQSLVLNKIRSTQMDMIYGERTAAAGICHQIGELYQEQRSYEKAITFFNEALKQDETHDVSMLALARLHLQRGDYEGCEHQCQALLRVDPGNEEAAMMLADLMFRKNKYEDAIYHFQQLLDAKPNNYKALEQYIQLLRRSGRLYECPKYMTLAEKATTRSRVEPGLHYIKGLYHRYCNQPREALKEFILGRNIKDDTWSEKCTIVMIEIYLNPDNENIWEEPEEANKEYVTENVKTAEKLLKSLAPSTLKSLLEAHCLIASKRKEHMEVALTKFYEIMTNDRSSPNANSPSNTEKVNVPCLVGMATALQMMKQTPKARNHLKRVAKAPYTQDEADDFERGWLLLADIYIVGGKFDLAQDLLKKALQANKTCSRAWEFMGHIYEKEQSYQDAADCYENAWRLVNESNPGIGYKLAFNYLKAKRYVNAIDICQKVLSKHATYPKIRKDILEKARALLRP